MATQKMGKWKFTDEEIEEQVHESAKLGEAELERPASEIRFSSSGKVVTLRFPDGFADLRCLASYIATSARRIKVSASVPSFGYSASPRLGLI